MILKVEQQATISDIATDPRTIDPSHFLPGLADIIRPLLSCIKEDVSEVREKNLNEKLRLAGNLTLHFLSLLQFLQKYRQIIYTKINFDLYSDIEKYSKLVIRILKIIDSMIKDTHSVESELYPKLIQMIKEELARLLQFFKENTSK